MAKNQQPEQSKEDVAIAEQIRTIFDESYTCALPSLKLLEKMQAAYECQMSDEWATYSQIYLPHFRTAVEQALPNVVNYLFPKSGMISINPNVPMPYEQVFRVQNYYDDLIQNKIGLKKNGLLTLKDCMKLNIGYGEVTTEIITPIDSIANTIWGGGEVKEIRRMELGVQKEVIKYNYIDWRTVIPTPDGATPEDASGVFRLKGIREDIFLDMYRLDKDSENPVLKGDPKKIIEAVRQGKTSLSHFPIWWVMGQFGNTKNSVKNIKKLNDINLRMNKAKSSPVIIPVLMSYFKREHIWLTPCGTVMYHIKDDIQTMRCPIVKATANPDGTEWYPMGDVGSSFDATQGSNTLQNALMDMLSYKLKPATVVNRNIIHDEEWALEAYGRFDAYGKVGDAVQVIKGPEIDQGMLAMGQMLQQEIAVANGQPQNLQGAGTAGIMRGGGGAFETFLQTTQARSKLAGAVLQTGWLEDVVNNVILLSQIIGQDDSYIYRDDLSSSFVEKTITANDMRHSFVATINLDDKFHQSPSERAMDMALYRDIYKDNPQIDQTAALEDVIGNRDKFKKLKASPEVEKQQVQQLQERAAAAEQAKQQAQGGGLNPGQQALDGNKSQGVAA